MVEKGGIKMEIDDVKKILIGRVFKFKGTEENVKDFEDYYLGRFCEIIFLNFS